MSKNAQNLGMCYATGFREKRKKMIFSERVKQLRKAKGWSQQELAKKIGGDARKISHYETGKVTPSIDAVIKLAEVFEISIDYLLLKDA